MSKGCKGVYIKAELIRSKGWLAMNGIEKFVFLIFRTKCVLLKSGRRGKETFDIINNGQLEFTYEEAWDKYGITSSRFVRAIDGNIEKGFIDIIETGAGTFKSKTLYAISDRWKLYGTPQFKEAKRLKRDSGYPGFKKTQLTKV